MGGERSHEVVVVRRMLRLTFCLFTFLLKCIHFLNNVFYYCLNLQLKIHYMFAYFFLIYTQYYFATVKEL